MPCEFRNEPPTDFTKDENRRAMAQAIEVAENLGQGYPMLVGGERVTLPKTFSSHNPSNPSEVIGTFPKGGLKEADLAIEAASKAFETWRNVPAKERAEVLFRTAKAIRDRKFEFAAWMCFEAPARKHAAGVRDADDDARQRRPDCAVGIAVRAGGRVRRPL